MLTPFFARRNLHCNPRPDPTPILYARADVKEFKPSLHLKSLTTTVCRHYYFTLTSPVIIWQFSPTPQKKGNSYSDSNWLKIDAHKLCVRQAGVCVSVCHQDNSKNTPGINMKICMRINVKKTNEFSVSFLKSEPQLEPLKIILYYARENAPHLGRKRCIAVRRKRC
jgi:hypothetical protein